ncbi:MAG: methyltransferase domain-containing protein [Candidatus Sumerlaeia bacterium]|nr:methyltransferase domain-containing protein [Candidatus Sumerlaeia bacterium]
MRGTLCSILACPFCRGTDWSLKVTEQNPCEILSGDLRCCTCGRIYPLLNGAVEFILDEDLSDLRRVDRDKSAESDRNILEMKRRGDFVGEIRSREDQYRLETLGRTDFFFRNLEYNHPEQRHVVDLGCGEPFLASRFARLGFNVVALDFTFPRLDLAHHYFETDGTYFERILGLMTRLPLRDHSMDIVFSHASLHHATPHDPKQFRWFDPNNMLDALREVRRVLKPDGLFLVSGEGVYPEELADDDRHLEHEAQRTGCYEAFYKLSEYEWAFRQAGIFPNLWAQWQDNRLRVGTFLGGHYREIVTPGDAVTLTSDLLISTPALRRDLDACLGKWARVRPWPGSARIGRDGGPLPLGDPATFVTGWHRPEKDPCGLARWMSRDPATIAFELDLTPPRWSVEFDLRAVSLLGEFHAALLIEREGRVVQKEIMPVSKLPAAGDHEFSLTTHLEPGPVTVRCIRDGRMLLHVWFNGDLLDTLTLPSDNQFHVHRIPLPPDKVRALNQLTLQPSYALRPSDIGVSNDDRWLSCFVRGVRLTPESAT